MRGVHLGAWVSRMARGVVVGAVIVTTAAPAGRAGATVQPIGHGYGRPWLAYVANIGSDDVSVIDTRAHRVIDTIGVGSGPLHVAITPDASKAYVIDEFSDNISVISTRTNTVIDTIDLGDGAFPQHIAITPDGTKAYVADYSSHNVAVIDTATDDIITTIPTGNEPRWVTIAPDGHTGYVTDSGVPRVAVIDTDNDVVKRYIDGVGPGDGLAASGITPDGKTLYVGNFMSHQVFAIDTDTGAVSAPIPVGSLRGEPATLTVAPSGLMAYVSDFADLAEIDTASNNVTTIPFPDYPEAVAFSPDSALAYVPVFDTNDVAFLDTTTREVVDRVGAGTYPSAVAVTPDQAPVARLSVSPARAGTPTLLNASASTVRFGTIATFEWLFGDGTTAVTRSPVTYHVYARQGRYLARVIETSSGGTSTQQVFTGQTMSRNGGPSAIASALALVGSSPPPPPVTPMPPPVTPTPPPVTPPSVRPPSVVTPSLRPSFVRPRRHPSRRLPVTG